MLLTGYPVFDANSAVVVSLDLGTCNGLDVKLFDLNIRHLFGPLFSFASLGKGRIQFRFPDRQSQMRFNMIKIHVHVPCNGFQHTPVFSSMMAGA